MKRLIWRWSRKWAVVDIVGLGMATVLAGAYYVFSDSLRNPQIGALWPNIATEVLGVWLSVRVIGAWLQSQREKRSVRSDIMGNLVFMTDLVDRLIPTFAGEDNCRLEREIRFFRDLKPYRFKKISRQERALVLEALELLERLHDQASTIGPQHNAIEDETRWPRSEELGSVAEELDKIRRR